MAYSSTGVNVILQSWGKFEATAGEDVLGGYLIDQDFGEADATAGQKPAKYIACEDIASGDIGWFCKQAVVKKPSTIATGGVVTRGNHSGTNGDVLFLSTTQGTAVEVVDGDGLGQMVGRVLSQDTALLDPSLEWDEDMEKETGAKTLTVGTDCGRAFYVCTTTDVTITLPAAASGNVFKIVNAAQDGDHLTTIAPNGSETIAGAGFSGGAGNDATNTKSGSKCGDYLILIAESGGWFVTGIRGVWAGA